MPARAKPRGGLGVASRVVEEDQVGSSGEHRLEVGADPVAQVAHRFRGRRVVAPGRPTDDRVTGADGEEQLGCGGNQRGDSAGRRRHGDGIARIVYQTKMARRGSRRSAGGHRGEQPRKQSERSGRTADVVGIRSPISPR